MLSFRGYDIADRTAETPQAIHIKIFMNTCGVYTKNCKAFGSLSKMQLLNKSNAVTEIFKTMNNKLNITSAILAAGVRISRNAIVGAMYKIAKKKAACNSIKFVNSALQYVLPNTIDATVAKFAQAIVL
jgi:hypothetical protein